MWPYSDVVREPIRPEPAIEGEYNDWASPQMTNSMGRTVLIGFAEGVEHPGITPPATYANIVSIQAFMVPSAAVADGNRR